MSIDPNKLLSTVPTSLRDPLLVTFREIATNFSEARWEPSELNGGKFCEVVYWIAHGYLTGAYVAKPSKPQNMKVACSSLESLPSTGLPGDRSLRILIARMLPPLYEIRNNRGVGHIGGDVDPNPMDSAAVFSMASWVLAELIRIFHQASTAEAQETVDALVERKTPLIWSPGTYKRVLDSKMPVKDQALLLLHQGSNWMDVNEIVSSVEYSSAAMFKKRVLIPLHQDRFIEYDDQKMKARISPKGIAYVEATIIAPRTAWTGRK